MAARGEMVRIASGGLFLEGLMEVPPDGGRRPVVVLCHPHPLYGGQMGDAVLASVADGLLRRGIAALRFNFRGVGASQGAYDGGVGETEDALAALEHAASADGVDAGAIGLAGYSFGAGVALRAALRDQRVGALALIACPAGALEHPEAPGLRSPKLLLSGLLDEFTPPQQFQTLAERFTAPREVHLLEGANHFFQGRTEDVGGRVARFFRRWLGEQDTLFRGGNGAGPMGAPGP